MATTVRVSEGVHEILKQEARAAGRSMQSVIEEAVELYRRRRFLTELNLSYARVREDERAWGDELAERRVWEQTASDGLGDD